MTKKFLLTYTCSHCGQQTTAESAFSRWMRNHPALDSSRGVVCTDTDYTILRFKTHGHGRSFQLLMDVEVKEFGAEPDPSQRDILNFKHALIRKNGKNVYGARTTVTSKITSLMLAQKVRVRYLGTHLLQFSRTNPEDSEWIKWDRNLIDAQTLVRVLSMDVDPYDVSRPMLDLLRDRHTKRVYPLFD